MNPIVDTVQETKRQLQVVLTNLVRWQERVNAVWAGWVCQGWSGKVVEVTDGIGIQGSWNRWLKVAQLVAVVEFWDWKPDWQNYGGTKKPRASSEQKKKLNIKISKGCRITKGWNAAVTDWEKTTTWQYRWQSWANKDILISKGDAAGGTADSGTPADTHTQGGGAILSKTLDYRR